VEKKIKVFLDSNVLFSIAYNGKDNSRSYLIYDIQEMGSIKVCFSALVCQEALFNIRRKRPEAEQFLKYLIDRSALLTDIYTDLKYTEIRELPQNDRIILSTAVYHKMDVFLTGNIKDFKIVYNKKILNTLILRPADFLGINRER